MAKQFGRMASSPVLSIALAAACAAFALSIALANTPAFADDRPNPSASPSFKGSDDSMPGHQVGVVPNRAIRPTGAPDDGDADHHQEIKDKYGNDVDKVFLPPLVVKGSNHSGGPVHNSGSTNLPAQSNTGLKNATQIDPAANPPINPNLNEVTGKTPADKFFQAASLGLGLMGVGAIALFGALLVQRRRHSAENH